MKNHYMKTTYFALVILLAVFGFVFLGTEYLFDCYDFHSFIPAQMEEDR